MKLEVLLGGLNNPQAAVRLDVVRVLGMTDETRALNALRQQYQAEPDPDVRNAIAWAGKRLYEAQQAGYSTIDEICRHFGVDREIENIPDANELAMMEKMQYMLDQDLIQMKERSGKNQGAMALAAGIGGTLMGGVTMGTTAMAGALGAGAGAASSNLGSGRPQIGLKRTPATAPSNADISVWVRRMREDPSAANRERAALELAELRNPAALPYFAAAFVLDDSPKVRLAAQRYGKILYWSAIYWEMDQDGSLVEEMQQRAQKLGKTIAMKDDSLPAAAVPETAPWQQPPQPPAAEPPHEEISEILRKAQAARARRQKK
jgi:hypothetical protein